MPAYDTNRVDVNSPQFAYVLGWAAADGCVEESRYSLVSWQLKDREPLEAIRRCMRTDKKIEVCQRRHGLFYRLRLCGRNVVELFKLHGIGPRKSLTLRMPELPNHLIPHFLRGLFEGDGHVSIAPGAKTNRAGYMTAMAQICSGSEAMLDDLQALIGYGFRQSPGKDNCGALVFKCGDAQHFLDMIYADSRGMRLSRKYEIAKKAQSIKYRTVA